MVDALAIGAAVISAPVGAALFRLAQIWLEKRAAAPSPASDTAAILAATATFQAALNVAADGVVERMKSEIQTLRDQCGQQAVKIEAQALRIDQLETAHGECEARTLTLEGLLNERGQQLESLARWFQRNGLDVPDLTGTRPFILLQPNLPGMTE